MTARLNEVIIIKNEHDVAGPDDVTWYGYMREDEYDMLDISQKYTTCRLLSKSELRKYKSTGRIKRASFMDIFD